MPFHLATELVHKKTSPGIMSAGHLSAGVAVCAEVKSAFSNACIILNPM